MSDCRELGLVPGIVEPWEDGRRHDPGDERAEVWHFDGELSNGATVALAFCLVGVDPSDDGRYLTVVNIVITAADGQQSVHAVPGTVAAPAVGTTRCILPFGSNHVEGDFTGYDLHVESEDGALALDLRYEALTEPYRPGGSGRIDLGDEARTFFSDVIVARCSISGTMTQDGERSDVSGEGYHDHQWFTSNPLTTWHHWLWGRLYTDAFTVVVFDLVASERFGFARVPLFGVFDADGRLVFDNRGPADSTSTVDIDDASGKELPRQSTYVFRDETRTFVLGFERVDVLLSRDLYNTSEESGGAELGAASREQFDELGVEPFYARYRAHGTLDVTDAHGTAQHAGEMVYEFNYPGRPDPRAPIEVS